MGTDRLHNAGTTGMTRALAAVLVLRGVVVFRDPVIRGSGCLRWVAKGKGQEAAERRHLGLQYVVLISL
jgi:hypothetical protein